MWQCCLLYGGFTENQVSPQRFWLSVSDIDPSSPAIESVGDMQKQTQSVPLEEQDERTNV